MRRMEQGKLSSQDGVSETCAVHGGGIDMTEACLV